MRKGSPEPVEVCDRSDGLARPFALGALGKLESRVHDPW